MRASYWARANRAALENFDRRGRKSLANASRWGTLKHGHVSFGVDRCPFSSPNSGPGQTFRVPRAKFHDLGLRSRRGRLITASTHRPLESNDEIFPLPAPESFLKNVRRTLRTTSRTSLMTGAASGNFCLDDRAPNVVDQGLQRRANIALPHRSLCPGFSGRLAPRCVTAATGAAARSSPTWTWRYR